MSLRDDAVFLANQAFIYTGAVGSGGPTNQQVADFNPDDPDSFMGTDEAQTVTITGAPTGGTFTLSLGGQTTAAIARNANAAAVQSALSALSTVGAGNVRVTGGPGPGTAWVVAFEGLKSATNVPQMTALGSFTGGTSPAIAVTTPAEGVAATMNHFGHTDLDEDISGEEEGGKSEVRGTRQRPNMRVRDEPSVESFIVNGVQFDGGTLRLYYGGGVETAGRFVAPATTVSKEFSVCIIYVDGDRRMAEYHDRCSVKRGGPIGREAENFMRAPVRFTPLASGAFGVQWINEDAFMAPAA